LIARGVFGAIKRLRARPVRSRRYVMACREGVGPKVARRLEQVREFDELIAGDAGHGRLAIGVARREAFDHPLPEEALVVEDIMRDADARRDIARVLDVLAGAAGAFAMDRGAVIVKL